MMGFSWSRRDDEDGEDGDGEDGDVEDGDEDGDVEDGSGTQSGDNEDTWSVYARREKTGHEELRREQSGAEK